MNLEDWEKYLRPHLSKIELLGEIPLGRDQHAELERAMKQFIQQHSLTDATHRFGEEYPAVFVTYLAFKAGFNEDRGFWDKVKQDLGIPNAQLHAEPTYWGRVFREIIQKYPNLRPFRDVSGHQYVTPIRLHGGIPAYSLYDFFEYILLPSVEKAPFDGMDDQNALNQLLQRSEAEYFVDDVVRHFFQQVPEKGLKFFAKCRCMARQVKKGEPLPAPQELGLRPYVVQAFENFQSEQQSTSSQRRLRPRIYFDPYGPGFRIVLPPQLIGLQQPGQYYEAKIYAPDNTGKVYAQQNRLRARQLGSGWMLDEVEWALEEPIETAKAGLFVQGGEEPIGNYPIHLLPQTGHPPLLVFGYEDQRLIPLTSTLPTRLVWLLFPADAEIIFDGEAKLQQTLPPFAYPWESWQAAAWDLSHVRLLHLQRDGQDICPPFLVSQSFEPFLLPSDLSPQVMHVDERPLYTTAPYLCIPLRNPDELKDSSLQLESCYAAAPQGKWQGKANELLYTIENSKALLSLAPWLEKSAWGTYHLIVQYHKRSFELPFCVCTGLSVHDLQPYYLPHQDQGAQEIVFTIDLPESARLVAEDETRLEVAKQGKCIKVTIPANASQADLCVQIAAHSETIQIPLRVLAPRLRWALNLEKGAVFEWRHQPISLPLAKLLQADLVSHRPRLRVELPFAEVRKKLWVALHLMVPGNNQPLQTSNSHSLTGQWLEFDLSAFFDTLRTPRESVFVFSLELLDAERNLNTCLSVLHLSSDLDIRICYLESAEGRYRLHWYEPCPVRHRRLRLWSCWQPWADPIELCLPDDAPASDIVDAEDWWMYDIPEEEGALPPSLYMGQFLVASPSENKPSSFPPENAIKIEMITSCDRLLQINEDLKSANPARAFVLHFEKLCIYHTQNRSKAMQVELQWCLQHWSEANLLHLEALARWLGKYDSKQNQLAFLIYMFRKETIKRLQEQGYPADFVQRYLENILEIRKPQPEVLRQVLVLSRNPKVILHCWNWLLKSDIGGSCQPFWEFVEQRYISEAGATDLLKNNPDFARYLFKNVSSSPLRTRLLRQLDLPEYLVKEGYYVLFDAGWGKITKICGKQDENYFLPDEQKPVLYVELLHWPNQSVKIDLERCEITLIDRNGANRCACGRFVALGGEQTRSTWQSHQASCGCSNISPVPSCFELKVIPVYRVNPPVNQFDTKGD